MTLALALAGRQRMPMREEHVTSPRGGAMPSAVLSVGVVKVV